MIDEDILYHVNRSSYRRRVLKTLNESPKMPRDIAKDSDILKNHISNVLTELRNLGLIVCINPEVRKGRVYRLSEEGEEIIPLLK